MSLARDYTCCLPVNVLPVQLVFVEYSVPWSTLCSYALPLTALGQHVQKVKRQVETR